MKLQTHVLETLAHVEPAFVLSGGGALVGVHLAHRTTRDLDLFWRNRAQLSEVLGAIANVLHDEGLDVSTLQSSPAFQRLRVSDGDLTAIVDLIAEPGDSLEQPIVHVLGRAEILVDTAQAILTEKLCALLERSEVRDLFDVRALVEHGCDLDAAIARAPQRDSGFSPLTLAWVLRDLDLTAIASSAGIAVDAVSGLEAFRSALIETLTRPV
jgi:predicted nucleotidyltransferase component of viral defense system